MNRFAIVLTVVLMLAGCTSQGEQKLPPLQAACPHPGLDGVCIPVHAELLLPAQVGVFRNFDMNWSLLNGSYGSFADPAHAMLSQVRMANASIPDDGLAGPETYGAELADSTRQHQNLPATFTTSLRLDAPGTYFVRVYMHARSTGFLGGNESDLWSPEVKLEVLPVSSTGVILSISHTMGGPTGAIEPVSTLAQLGDSIQFDNQDLIEHEFVFTDVPPGFQVPRVVVPAQSTSDVFLLDRPGGYRIAVDDALKSMSADITVRA